jgi:aryl-alcohol dehydrogenase-like predicted oxidoreductase
MRRRTLGSTELAVSEVGYGGGRVRADADPAAVAAMLHHAFDAGINYIDTAASYGGGLSETVIGRAIAGRRDDLVIATKTKSRDPREIPTEVEGSLRRLGVDVIDVLQFHGGYIPDDDATAILDQGGLDAYRRLREEGKIRYLGFSTDGPSGGAERLVASGAFDMVQVHYNLMYQGTHDMFGDTGLIPAADAQGMGVVLMRSTTSGVFRRLMRRSFPTELADVDLDAFLLNYSLSNPLVDSALMSLGTNADVDWTNAVSDDIDARIDLRRLHKG